ncbi:fimbria/pilus outer membrane usher protein [Serratia marcescens]|uniref:fimbria/pilus outer membrane usher protein n=1 Tax=Serratia marcescens TaxID=615 RepID=UPI0022374A4A|nr:fimbria/pilus outer membrane usher protein [Serratia marcescens]
MMITSAKQHDIQPNGGPALRVSRLAMVMALLLSVNPQGWAADSFNPNALEIDNPSTTPVDLSQFSDSGSQAPGTYRVDIYMNGEQQDTRDVTFILGSDGKLKPRLTPAQLEQWGVMLTAAPTLMGLAKDAVITDLSRYIPQADTQFDFSHQALNISVPQASMKPSAQGAVDPKYWDEGIPAMLLDYSFTGANNRQDNGGGHNDSYFLNLHSGVNLGGWRLRNYSTWNYSKSGRQPGEGESAAQSHWDSINTFIQHDVDAIKGQFTAGESYTPSDVFDSIQFRGAQLASDDNMLPDSLRGFAPTVRGIANSNAQVTIRQNGSVIYQTYVPPGAFTINDLYPTSSSGDLQVTIREASGAVRTFVQPFSNVPGMQREGRMKYAFTVGKYRAPNSYDDEPLMGQATLMYGLPHDMTVYGGFQTANNYSALALGMGVGLGEMGSVSLDATQAYTTLGPDSYNESKEGQSYRFQYSKDIQATDSTVTLAGYRYSTRGFYSFSEAMDYRAFDEGNYFNIHNNKRSKVQLNLTQNLMGGQWGALSFSGYQQDYWNESGYERNASVGYSNSWDGISWTLMYTYTRYANTNTNNNQQLALNISVPLSRWLPGSYATASTTSDLRGRSHNQMGVSGTALEGDNLSYSVAQGYGNRGEGYSGLASADYRGTYGEVNAGYNYFDGAHQVNYGMQGSVIAHPYGVTLGQSLGGDMSSVALVRAPGASGTRVQNGTGVYTDWRGYTIVPYLSTYRRTRIALDPATLGDDVDMKENVASVVPTAGAVVLADFKTHVGNRVLMTLLQGGKAVPFGATVAVDGDDDNAGIVGEEGQVYLSGVPQSGTVVAKWGNGGAQQCRANFALPALANTKTRAVGVLNTTANCG